jgi:TPP-dependent pyruvate/acetoin dehydrogenase alpha subunit
MSKEEIEEIDRAANQIIDEAANKAILMPEPTSENMEDEVFAP